MNENLILKDTKESSIKQPKSLTLQLIKNNFNKPILKTK